MYIHIRVRRLIHIPWDILLPVYVYLLYLLDGTVAAWMKSSVFIHLMQLPSNPIIFGFGQLALRCDFSKTKIQPLTIKLDKLGRSGGCLQSTTAVSLVSLPEYHLGPHKHLQNLSQS